MKRWLVIVRLRFQCPHGLGVVVLLRKAFIDNLPCLVADLCQKCTVPTVDFNVGVNTRCSVHKSKGVSALESKNIGATQTTKT